MTAADRIRGGLSVVQPVGWPRPRGYANGIEGRGRVLCVAGQIAWDDSAQMVSDDFVAQFDRALRNVVAVVEAAEGKVHHIARLTIYVTDLDAYRSQAKAIGVTYRSIMGKHYPAMALVGVAGLVEPRAKIEIEATAILPE
jgi:enamine deaminase RidA (YjgF/YER057c/UK114 family)